jgi:hypothetical protein
VDSQACTYGRDDLARLASVGCGSLWGQTFTLDRWGNLAKSGNQSFGALYGANNRIASNGSVVPQYDADGNLLDDPVTGSNANAFDADGHAVKLEGVNVTFDALGRAVEASDWQGTAELLYGPEGGKLAVMSGQTLLRADVPLPEGGTAVYNSSGLQYYTHADDLGSTRPASTPGHAVYYSAALAPYGETYAPTGSTNPSVGSFTGQHQDIAGGQYDFLARELSANQGRWWTPDPAGLAAVDPVEPVCRDGAVKGAIGGAWGGGVAVGALSPGIGAVQGAIAGGLAVGVIGASAGVLWGSAAAAACDAAGAYGR